MYLQRNTMNTKLKLLHPMQPVLNIEDAYDLININMRVYNKNIILSLYDSDLNLICRIRSK